MGIAQNTMGTQETLEWRRWWEGPGDLNVGESPDHWKRLPPTQTKRNEGDAVTYP